MLGHWLCLVGWHRWALRVSFEYKVFLFCTRCKKRRPLPWHPGGSMKLWD